MLWNLCWFAGGGIVTLLVREAWGLIWGREAKLYDDGVRQGRRLTLEGLEGKRERVS